MEHRPAGMVSGPGMVSGRHRPAATALAPFGMVLPPMLLRARFTLIACFAMAVGLMATVPVLAQIPPDRSREPAPSAPVTPSAPGTPPAPGMPMQPAPGAAAPADGTMTPEAPPPLPPNTVVRLLSDGRPIMIGPARYATEFRMQATLMMPDGSRRRLEDGLHRMDDGTQFRVRRGLIVDGR